MPRIRSEEVEKKLTQFLRREMKVKHGAQLGELRRFKQTTTLTRGRLPSLHMRTQGTVKYAVYITFGTFYRIYLFSPIGNPLGAQSFTSPDEFTELKKQSRKLYGFPPKKKEKGFEEQNQILNNNFLKALDTFTTKFQTKKPKLPLLSLVAAESLTENEFGLKRAQNLVQVPAAIAKDTTTIEAMLLREILHVSLPPFLQKSVVNEDFSSLLAWACRTKYRQKLDEEWERASRVRGTHKEKKEWQTTLEKEEKRLKNILDYLYFLRTYINQLSSEETYELINFILYSDLQNHLNASFELFKRLYRKQRNERFLLLQGYFGLTSKVLSLDVVSDLFGQAETPLLSLVLDILNFKLETYYKERRNLQIENKDLLENLLEHVANVGITLSIDKAQNTAKIENKTDQNLRVIQILYAGESKEDEGSLNTKIDPFSTKVVRLKAFIIEDENKFEIRLQNQHNAIFELKSI
ncbi:MAG: hypothetical protein ACFFCZ_19485 [Promethearchaeota archaeon]